jgi:hypothetical protein
MLVIKNIEVDMGLPNINFNRIDLQKFLSLFTKEKNTFLTLFQ